MSTYVYISRRADPFDDDGPKITAEEGQDCLKDRLDFRAPRKVESEWSGQYASVWTGHELPIVFNWSEGQIEVKNPDAPIIARMKRLATDLSANVFSEHGELFDDAGGHSGFLPGFP